VVTATTARDPVLARAWLAPGTHVNAVGASRPPHREIDATTWSAAAVFVDRRESVEREAADYRRALDEGGIEAGHIRAEIGDVLLGRARGRTSPDEITLFRSLGLAVEDVAAAQYVLQRAQASGTGTIVDF
jgi:ornithine cyclodeaminase